MYSLVIGFFICFEAKADDYEVKSKCVATECVRFLPSRLLTSGRWIVERATFSDLLPTSHGKLQQWSVS
jgi:hypothetical protein